MYHDCPCQRKDQLLEQQEQKACTKLQRPNRSPTVVTLSQSLDHDILLLVTHARSLYNFIGPDIEDGNKTP